jgi:hypothetical protein
MSFMAQANTKTIPSRRWRASQMPRSLNGRFQAVPRPAPAAVDWQLVHAWKDAWRLHRQRVEAAKREHRWGGLRSIALFALMSSVLVGLLIAGAGAMGG